MDIWKEQDNVRVDSQL